MDNCRFDFCGTFSGDDSKVLASTWLKKYEHELRVVKLPDGSIPAATYLEHITMLFEGTAATWAATDKDAIAILSHPIPSSEQVVAFKSLFLGRFPINAVAKKPISFHTELAQSSQQNETITQYYYRLDQLMQRIGRQDRQKGQQLTELQEFMLESIMDRFIQGLSDPQVRTELTRLSTSQYSLRGLYDCALAIQCMFIEVQKLKEAENKDLQLRFYRKFFVETVRPETVQFMMAVYQVDPSIPHTDSFLRPETPHSWSTRQPQRPQLE